MAGLLVIVALAVAFDFINGFHDAANSIATIVSTRVLSPRTAVMWAAFFNFVAFLVLGVAVAQSIAKGVHPSVLSLPLVGAALTGAIVWNLITWWLGLPTSSSHALLGGLAGAAIAKAGFGALDPPVFIKTGAFIVIAPLIGFLLGGLLMRALVAAFGTSSPRFDRSWTSPPAPAQPRRACTRSATAATTRRRRWVSSRWRSSRAPRSRTSRGSTRASAAGRSSLR